MTKKQTPTTISLRAWALREHLHPQTAYGWLQRGVLPVEHVRKGRLIRVLLDETGEPRYRTDPFRWGDVTVARRRNGRFALTVV